MTENTAQLEQELTYYRDVVIPSMRAREAVMTREWGNLWHDIQEDNAGRLQAGHDDTVVHALIAENEQLKRELSVRIQNHVELSEYSNSIEERCKALESIDERRGKEVWHKACRKKNTNRKY